MRPYANNYELAEAYARRNARGRNFDARDLSQAILCEIVRAQSTFRSGFSDWGGYRHQVAKNVCGAVVAAERAAPVHIPARKSNTLAIARSIGIVSDFVRYQDGTESEWLVVDAPSPEDLVADVEWRRKVLRRIVVVALVHRIRLRAIAGLLGHCVVLGRKAKSEVYRLRSVLAWDLELRRLLEERY